MNDPLDRDKFPNRPDHPDFWKLSKVLLANDASVIEDGKSIPDTVRDIIDPAVLEYHAMNRVGLGAQLSGAGQDPRLLTLLGAIWIDAFAAGARFAKAES